MGKRAFLMAGQGSQFPGMARDLYTTEDNVRALFDKAEVLRPGTLAMMFDGSAEELKQTDNTQPCLFLADLAPAIALHAHGIVPDAVAGFSLGEIAALSEAGILDAEDAFRLVCVRGISMQSAAEKTPGTMLAVLRAERSAVESMCAECGVYAVNYNCPGQIVVAGETGKIDAMKELLTAKGVRFIPLAVGGAFHTPYMSEASASLREALTTMALHAPSIPLYANRTAQPYPGDADGQTALITAQVANSVLWEDTIRAMAADGVEEFIECGPGKTLGGLVRKTLPEARVYSVGDVPSLADYLSSIRKAVGA